MPPRGSLVTSGLSLRRKCPGLEHDTEAEECLETLVKEHWIRNEAVPERSCGVYRRENAGMSVARRGRILSAEYLKVSRVKLICPGSIEVRSIRRGRVVADGQQVEFLYCSKTRTVGTRVESIGAEWKAACKRGRSPVEKPQEQSERRDANKKSCEV